MENTGMDEGSEQIVYTVPEGVERERADKVLANYLTDLSRTVLQESFDLGHVVCKGKPLARRSKVSAGDELHYILPKAKVINVEPVEMSLEVIYEDDDIIALNKAPGVVVHPGSGTGSDTLVHGLLHYTKGKLSSLGGELRPGVVHRLDKETSGVIVFAKSDEAYLSLIKLFSGRQVKKEYLALVKGIPELDSGVVKEPIGRHPVNRTRMAVNPKGRAAHTEWAVEKRLRKCALVRCWLHTGRTHQIRVHLSHTGHVILGDPAYGYKAIQVDLPPVPRVLLHAEYLAFEHPVSGKLIELRVPLPKDFTDYIASVS